MDKTGGDSPTPVLFYPRPQAHKSKPAAQLAVIRSGHAAEGHLLAGMFLI